MRGHWEIRGGRPLFVRPRPEPIHAPGFSRRRWTEGDMRELMSALAAAGPATSTELGRMIGRPADTVLDHLRPLLEEGSVIRDRKLRWSLRPAEGPGLWDPTAAPPAPEADQTPRRFGDADVFEFSARSLLAWERLALAMERMADAWEGRRP